MIDFLWDVVCIRRFWLGVASGWLASVLVVLASFARTIYFSDEAKSDARKKSDDTTENRHGNVD
jgi:hypothetical protein